MHTKTTSSSPQLLIWLSEMLDKNLNRNKNESFKQIVLDLFPINNKYIG